MDEVSQYEKYLRDQITKLRSQKGISEHRLSLELGKSGSYIRSITSGATMPSMKELFNIMAYFEVSPPEFFSGLKEKNSLRAALEEKLQQLSNEDLEKVSLFISWITERATDNEQLETACVDLRKRQTGAAFCGMDNMLVISSG